MLWLIALCVLILLACLPLGICALYDTGGPRLWLILGPIRKKLYPRAPNQKDPKQEKPEKAQKTKGTRAAAQKKGGKLKDFYPLLEKLLELLYTFKSKLRVNRLELQLILANSDPADLAVNYGKAWAALGNLMPQLERFLTIKKRNLEVECDFTAEATLIYARADVTITLGRLLYLVVVHGFRVLREYLKIMKLRKGGAKT